MPLTYPGRTIKRLRIHLAPDGTMTGIADQCIDTCDEWWESVMDDPRARARARARGPRSRRPRNAALAGMSLYVISDRCPVRIVEDGEKLAGQFAPDAPVRFIATQLAKCSTRPKWCRVRYEIAPKD